MPDSCVSMFVPFSTVLDTRTLGSTEVSDYPLSNVEQTEMWKKGGASKHTDGYHKIWAVDVFGTTPIKVVSLYGHNFSTYMPNGLKFRWRVVISEDNVTSISGGNPDFTWADLTLVYDSDWLDPHYTADYWEDQGGGYVPHLTHVIPSDLTADSYYVAVFIEPLQAQPPNFIFSRLIVGPGLQPPFSASPGSGLVHTEATPTVEMESGVTVISSNRLRRRGLKFQLDSMTEAQYYNSIYEPIIVRAGFSFPFLAILDPSKPEYYHLNCCLGTLDERTVQSLYTGFDSISTSFTVKEFL